MYSPLFLLFLLSVLFNFCSAVKTQNYVENVQYQLPQCNYANSSLQFPTSVPIFAPFTSNGDIDEAKIPIYAKILQARTPKLGVQLLTPQAGGDLLTLKQKLQIVNGWYTVKSKTGFPTTILCDIGGISLNDTLALAAYCAKRCDGLVLTEIRDYPLPTIAAYVNCVKGIAAAYPSARFFFSELILYNVLGDLNSAKRFAMLYKSIKNFAGYIASYENCLQIKAVNYLGKISLISDTSANIIGPLAFCLNGTSTLIASICPECITGIREAFYEGDLVRALKIQEALNTFYETALGLKYKPDTIDRTQLGYIIAVIRRVIYRRFGLDLGYLPACPRLTQEDISRIDNLCESDLLGSILGGKPYGYDEDVTPKYYNEEEDSYL